MILRILRNRPHREAANGEAQQESSTGTVRRRTPAGCFIAGTDTGVGKTVVTTAIIRAFIDLRLRVAAMKPVASGSDHTPEGLRNEDAMALASAVNVDAPYELINPYCFVPPISPHITAAEAGVQTDPQVIVRSFRELSQRSDCVIIEGVGGWMTPIGRSATMADIARALHLPVVLVIGLRLGCLNHALLSARAIRDCGLVLAGWMGNRIDRHFERVAENLATLESMLSMPPLSVLPFCGAGAPPPSLAEDAAWRLRERLRLPATAKTLT